MSKLCCFVILVGILTGLDCYAASASHLKIAVSDAHSESKPYQEIMRFMKNALSRDKVEIEFISLPIERGSALADSGDIDGELARVKLLPKEHSNLIETSFPYILVRYILVHRQDVLLTFKNISTLQGVIPLNVRGVDGFIADNKLKTIGVKTFDAALDMLIHKRCDYIIMSDAVFAFYKKSDKRFSILEQSRDFSLTLPLYFRLNKKRKNLMPLVEKAIKRERQVYGGDYPDFQGYYGF